MRGVVDVVEDATRPFSWLRRSWRAVAVISVAAVVAPFAIVDAPASASSPGPANQLVFLTAPSGAKGGQAFTTQPQVEVEDADGNVVTTDNSTVTLALSGGAGTLSGCSQTEASGVITFSGCQINTAGTTYKLTATDGMLASAETGDFTVAVGAVAQVVFTTNPVTITAGTDWTAAPTLDVEDAGGNVVTSSSDSVALVVSPEGQVPLACSGTETAISSGGGSGYKLVVTNGVASFTDCTINKASSAEYELFAVATDGTNGGTFEATSPGFYVNGGTATQLAFTNEPAGAHPGLDFASQPVVAVEDAVGNVDTNATGTVDLELTPSTANGATLSCGSASLVAGVATFAGCAINTAGTGYTLTATYNSFSVVSSSFDATTSDAGELTFATTPLSVTAGVAFSTQPEVDISSSLGSPVGGDVTLALVTSSETATSAQLTCTLNPQPAGDGDASFSGCAVDRSGTYRLKATDAENPSLVSFSSSFTVAPGAATALVFESAAPLGTTGGSTLSPTPQVAFTDAGGVDEVADGAAVTLSIASGTGTAGATLTCADTNDGPNTDLASDDAYTFDSCSINETGTGYRLMATGDGMVALSAPFDVSVGTPTKLVFVTSPSTSYADDPFGIQPEVAIADAGGNRVVGAADSAITLTASNGQLSCPFTTVSTLQGLATFAGCADDLTGSVTLTATSETYGSVQSAPFTVETGPVTTPPSAVFPSAQSVGSKTWSRNPTEVVDDVNTLTGALTFSNTDLTVAGIGVPFQLTRTYESNGPGGLFGDGFSSLLDAGVTINTAARTATLRSPDGQELVFTETAAGGWGAPAGSRATVTCVGTACTARLVDGVTMTSTGGRITSYLSASGQGLAFLYSAGVLSAVSVMQTPTPLLVQVTIANGHVTELSTPTRSVSYGYTGNELTSYTDADGNTWHYDYANGLLEQVVAPGDVPWLTATWSADQVAQVTSTAPSDAFASAFTYDTTGDEQVTSIETVDDVGNNGPVDDTASDVYDNGALVSQTNPLSETTDYGYDSQFDATVTIDANLATETLTYDQFGDVLTQTMPAANGQSATTRFGYNANHQLLSETDPLGHTTTYTYNGVLLASTTPPGGSALTATSYKYNNLGERTEVDGPLSITTFTYDGAGNQTGYQVLNLSRQPIDGLGPVKSYDEAGDVVSQTSADGHSLSGLDPAYTTTSTYDADGNLLEMVAPGDQVTVNTYAPDDVLTSTQAPNGALTTYSWNAAGTIETITTDGVASTKQWDESGNLIESDDTTYVFNGAGEMVTETTPAGVVTNYGYDNVGDVASATDNLGDTSTYTYGPNQTLVQSTVNGVSTTSTYDLDGNVLTTSDGDGNVTSYTYNAQGQVASTTDNAGRTQFRYDADGDLTSVTSPDGDTTYYGYNGAGDETSMVVNGETWSYRYDDANQLVGETDPDGRVTTYTLNAQGLRTATTYAQAGQSTINITATYNGAGQMTSLTDPTVGETTFTYNSNGQLTSESNSLGTFSYDYSTPGEMTETYPDGRQITYTLDANGNVMSVATTGVSVEYERNTARQVTGVVEGDGLVQSDSYNAAGEVTSQTLSCGSDVRAATATSYDAAGNPLGTVTDVQDVAVTERFGYNGTNELAADSTTSAASDIGGDANATCTSGTTSSNAPAGDDGSGTSSNTTTPSSVSLGEVPGVTAPTTAGTADPITYDGDGNQLTNDGTDYSYNAADELISSYGNASSTATYDKSGNLTSLTTNGVTTTFQYNAADELDQVSDDGTVVAYAYDGLGNIVTRTVTGAVDPGVEHYLWDPNAATPLLAEITSSDATVIDEFIYGVGPVAMVTGGTVYYLTTDAQGSVATVADATGTILESITYNGWGVATVTDTGAQNPPASIPLLYEGQLYDPLTGLYDLRARQYDPALGRFTQRDPVKQSAGDPAQSPYVYASDQPTVLEDPTGQTSQLLTNAFEGHSTESANAVADAGYGLKLVGAVRGLYRAGPKIQAFLEESYESVSEFASAQLAKAKSFFGDEEESATSEISDVADAAAPEIEELGGEIGGELAESGGDAAAGVDVAGKALGVIGLGLGVYVAYEDCSSYADGHGSLSQCIGDSVGLALGAACLALTEGVGAFACGLASAGIALVISKYGPQIYEGLVDLGQYAYEGLTIAYTAIAQGFEDAGTWIVGTYGTVASTLSNAYTSAANFLSNSYATAVSTLTNSYYELSDEVTSGFDAALQGLEEAGYTAVQMADWLSSQFQLGYEDVVEFLNSLGYDADQVMKALDDVYQFSEQAAADVLYGLNYAYDQIADGLKSVYSALDTAAAKVIAALGATVDEVGAALESVYQDTAAVAASALAALNYTYDEIASGLQSAYDVTAQAIVSLLQDVGATLTEVANTLADVYQQTVAEIVSIYQTLGEAVNDIASALQGAFNLVDSAVASFLQAAGYTADQIAGALSAVFDDIDSTVASILQGLGYTASEIASTLESVFSDAASAVESILSDIGFSSSVISAIGGAFSSFGSDLESVGDTIASWF